MAIRLLIKGTPIEIPSSAQGPNWSGGIIEALQALTDAVNAVTGTYDVAPQIQNIDANNQSTNVTINNLQFPISEVRTATIYYAVNRKTEDSGPPDGVEVSEGGQIQVTYNEANPIGNKWEIAQFRSSVSAQISFAISDTGQMTFTTTALPGVQHTGTLSYRAISVLNT